MKRKIYVLFLSKNVPFCNWHQQKRTVRVQSVRLGVGKRKRVVYYYMYILYHLPSTNKGDTAVSAMAHFPVQFGILHIPALRLCIVKLWQKLKQDASCISWQHANWVSVDFVFNAKVIICAAIASDLIQAREQLVVVNKTPINGERSRPASILQELTDEEAHLLCMWTENTSLPSGGIIQFHVKLQTKGKTTGNFERTTELAISVLVISKIAYRNEMASNSRTLKTIRNCVNYIWLIHSEVSRFYL